MSYPNPMGNVRLLRNVRSEDQIVIAGIGRAAPAGTFPFTMNDHGAVSVILAGAELLGVKPDEFAWVEVREPLTLYQVEVWVRHGMSPVPFMRMNLDDRTVKLRDLIDRRGETIEAALSFVALFDSQSIVDAELCGIESIEEADAWRGEVTVALNELRDVLPEPSSSDNSDATKQN